MEKEIMIENLKSLKTDILNTLRYTEPLNLPHKPYRMTVEEKDVSLLESVIHYLESK